MDKVRAGPVARQASGVPAGGKVAGGLDAAAYPQMVHEDEPVFAVYPVAQLWQADAPMLPVLLLNVLAGHAEQERVAEL